MPDVEVADLQQTAVLWPFAYFDAKGEAIVAKPMQVRCRWIGKRTIMMDKDGKPVQVDATVFVSKRIELNGYMQLGELLDLPPGTNFFGESKELMVIKYYGFTPDVRGRSVRRQLGLMRVTTKLTLPG